MKSIFKISKMLACWWLVLHGNLLYAQTEIVTLQGRKFDLDGNEFFIKAVNYEINVGFIGSVPYITRDAGYGTTINRESNTVLGSLSEIASDFERIKNMGFNTIR